MTPDIPSLPPPPPVSAQPPASKKTHWLLYGCGTLVALLLIIVATVAFTLWRLQRPIKPVVLSTREKAEVDEKLRPLDRANPPSSTASGSSPSNARPTPPLQESDRIYTPGSKVLKLTEREINGLLNANTELGKSLRLEFARDAINAYVVVPIPSDFPVGGGRMFRARGRFLLSVGNGGTPMAALEDVTVFGVSLPKAWLGGLKGENLLERALGRGDSSPKLRGIKSLRVEPGALVLELDD